jgi:hypothetical protein
MSQEEPILIVLTPAQREIVHRVSGQHVEAIELMPNQAHHDDALRAHWRLSATSGIPRQQWMTDEDGGSAKDAGEPSQTET